MKKLMLIVLASISVYACCGCAIVSGQMNAIKSSYQSQMSSLDSQLTNAWKSGIQEKQEVTSSNNRKRIEDLADAVALDKKRVLQYDELAKRQSLVNNIVSVNKNMEAEKSYYKGERDEK